MWLSVLAFGRQAEALAKHRKGELLSVAGNMQVSQWTGQNGGNAAGLAGYRRQRNQCACGTSWREQTQNHRHTGGMSHQRGGDDPLRR